MVISVINLVSESSRNYELLSCRILFTLSDVPRLEAHFFQESQITILKVFNDKYRRKTKLNKK